MLCVLGMVHRAQLPSALPPNQEAPGEAAQVGREGKEMVVGCHFWGSQISQ